MLKNVILAAGLALASASGAFAAGGAKGEVENVKFPFDGIFGKFDQAQLQRGLQVYTEVCANCHGLEFVAFRNLGDEGGPGLSEDQVKAYAAQFEVFDEEIDDFRPAAPADHFPASALENAPDLSLMAKARGSFHDGIGFTKLYNGIGGPEYILALLTNYTGVEVEEAGSVLYENKIYGNIAMAAPLEDGQVEYTDGHANDVYHMSEDVAAFLMWTAEPKLMARKRWGLVFVGLFGLLSVLLYLTNKSIWYRVKHPE